MARLQGISGGMSGRTGSFTYRQSRGQTIVSQYQPMVKNPNTKGQQNQRAKFKLMSQLAAVMAAGFGSFILKTRPEKQRPTQRNAFMQLNMPLVEVDSTTDTATAKIPMEQLQLTSSFKNMPQLDVTSTSAENFNVALRSSLPVGVASVRIIVVGYVDNVATIVEMRDVPAANLDGESVNFGVGAGKFTVLAYGLIPSESLKKSVDFDNIHTPADEDFISAVDLNTMVSKGTMTETMTVGANVTVASA